MNRRTFTLAGFFGSIGAVIGKALGYDGTPEKLPSKIMPEGLGRFIDVTTGVDAKYSIKVGRKIMVLPDGVLGARSWHVYSASVSDRHGHHVHLAQPPEDLKRWNEVPDVLKPKYSKSFPAKVSMLHELLGKLEALEQSPFTPDARELRARIRDLEQEIRLEIKIRATMCDGHNGPSVLTEMTDMPDGRRLCAYCHKQETDNVDLQLDGDNRGQAPSS